MGWRPFWKTHLSDSRVIITSTATNKRREFSIITYVIRLKNNIHTSPSRNVYRAFRFKHVIFLHIETYSRVKEWNLTRMPYGQVRSGSMYTKVISPVISCLVQLQVVISISKDSQRKASISHYFTQSGQLGFRDGTVARALASHHCHPGSIPRLSIIWVEFVDSVLCSERFFSRYSGFPLSSKTNT